MAKASNATFEIHREALQPLEHAMRALADGLLTKAHRTNREYTAAFVSIDEHLSREDQLLFFDPQTSGGLLLSVAPEQAQSVCQALSPVFAKTTVIGTVAALQNKYVIYDQ